MLSPEEKSLLENAKSLINEIESMQEGEASEEEEVEMQMDDEEEREEEKVEESSNADVQKQESEGSTASDDADERIEDLPEQTEENVDEVAKAIVKLLTKKQPVRKSRASSGNRDVLTALNALTQVVKSLAESQSEHDTALGHILEGLGVTEAIKTVEKSDKKPVVNNDQTAVLNELVTVIKGLQDEKVDDKPEQDRMAVRKSLGEALPMIFDKNRYQG